MGKTVIKTIDDLVDLVKARRKALGMTWPYLTDRAGVSQNAVFQWEGLKAGPCLLNAVNMLEVLGLRIVVEEEEKRDQGTD